MNNLYAAHSIAVSGDHWQDRVRLSYTIVVAGAMIFNERAPSAHQQVTPPPKI
jgi:hypothetical protein